MCGVDWVGGLLGIILLGVFAGTAVNSAGAVGLVHASASFFFKQVAAGLGCSLYACAFTYGALKLINLIILVRTTDAAVENGLDEQMHGGSAYAL